MMSTHWYFECRQHDPAIRSDNSLNHGQKELAELLSAFKDGRIPRSNTVGDFIEIEVQIWCSSWPWWFLMAHPDCKIAIVSEYDDTFVDGVIYRRDGSILGEGG